MSWWNWFIGKAPATKSNSPTSSSYEDLGLPPLSDGDDPLYYDAVSFVLETQRASVSSIQRRLSIGYNRAARMIEAMELDGIVSPMNSNGSREVIAQGSDLRALVTSKQAAKEAAEQEKARKISYLIEKYQDEETVRRIMEHTVWEGMTSAQLFDALGQPEAVDQKYLKQVSREVWKYNQQGKGRYAAKITLENGFVVGWDFKE